MDRFLGCVILDTVNYISSHGMNVFTPFIVLSKVHMVTICVKKKKLLLKTEKILTAFEGFWLLNINVK